MHGKEFELGIAPTTGTEVQCTPLAPEAVKNEVPEPKLLELFFIAAVNPEFAGAEKKYAIDKRTAVTTTRAVLLPMDIFTFNLLSCI